MDNHSLHEFILKAKSVSYVGNGKPASASRPASHDLKFEHGDWAYLDSYFGGRNFIGEEVVYFQGQPVWGMNYYGRILRSDLITPVQAGQVIKASLSKMYFEGHFLGGYEYRHAGFRYVDASDGDVTSFRGREYISLHGETAYELFYHGGLILDD